MRACVRVCVQWVVKRPIRGNALCNLFLCSWEGLCVFGQCCCSVVVVVGNTTHRDAKPKKNGGTVLCVVVVQKMFFGI